MSSDARRPHDPPGKVLSDLLEKLKASSRAQLALAAALVLVSVIGLCQISGLAARLRPLPMPTSTPTAMPSATRAPTSAPTATAEATPTATETAVPVVMVGTSVEVVGTGTDELRVRVAPGVTEETIATFEDGTRLIVVDGPEALDGYTWWRVKTEEGQQGWVAEDWLVPVVP